MTRKTGTKRRKPWTKRPKVKALPAGDYHATVSGGMISNRASIEVTKETWKQKVGRLEGDVERLSTTYDRISADLDICRRELDIHREYKSIIEHILRV